jgi:hypothetical protein
MPRKPLPKERIHKDSALERVRRDLRLSMTDVRAVVSAYADSLGQTNARAYRIVEASIPMTDAAIDAVVDNKRPSYAAQRFATLLRCPPHTQTTVLLEDSQGARWKYRVTSSPTEIRKHGHGVSAAVAHVARKVPPHERDTPLPHKNDYFSKVPKPFAQRIQDAALVARAAQRQDSQLQAPSLPPPPPAPPAVVDLIEHEEPVVEPQTRKPQRPGHAEFARALELRKRRKRERGERAMRRLHGT